MARINVKAPYRLLIITLMILIQSSFAIGDENKIQIQNMEKKGIQEFDKGNYMAAYEYFKQDCNNGIAEGCYNLGRLHYYGLNRKEDVMQARQYWVIAARQGSKNAKDKLKVLCKNYPWACKNKTQQDAK